MKIGVIGGGVVGQATARTYLEHVEDVRVWDVVRERRTHPLDAVLDCDLIFVCLPTPQKEWSLECDLTAVDQFFTALETPSPDHQTRNANFVLRSTVPIGTTRRLRERYGLTNLVHSPEFLTARCANTDAQMPARNIIGIPDPPKVEELCKGVLVVDKLTRTGDNRAAQTLNVLYHQRFPGVPCLLMTSDESEAVKLIQNGLFAVTVAYWNEARCLADALGLNWDRVQEAILLDGRVSRAHAKVPGLDGKRGFGGSCLPKDLANLVRCMASAGVMPDDRDEPMLITETVYFRNLKDRQRS